MFNLFTSSSEHAAGKIYLLTGNKHAAGKIQPECLFTSNEDADGKSLPECLLTSNGDAYYSGGKILPVFVYCQ